MLNELQTQLQEIIRETNSETRYKRLTTLSAQTTGHLQTRLVEAACTPRQDLQNKMITDIIEQLQQSIDLDN